MSKGEKVLRKWAVLETTGLSSASLYRLIKSGNFPKQIKITDNLSGWLSSEIEGWIADRVASRNNSTAAQ